MEIWKTIPGYEAYEVSNHGRVKSHYSKRDRILKPMTNAGKYNGYLCVSLFDSKGRMRKVKVHRLVAEAFIPNPNGYAFINHKDEDKTNNNVGNLEWCTKLYNNTYGTARQRSVETRRKNLLAMGG